MSTLTYGPPVSIELPPPTPPPYNLLTVAIELSGSLDGEGGFDPHWRSGADLWPYPPDLASGEDPCAEGTFDTKDEGSAPTLPRFGAFTVYQPIICSALSTHDFDELERRTKAALAAHEANAVERQLADAAFKFDNPSLASEATLLASGAAVSPTEGLALLEEAIGATAQGGLIHATPDTVVAWSALGNAIERDGSRLRSLGGTPIARGTGYIDMQPAAPAAAPAADQAWAWATGPVVYRRSEQFELDLDISQVLDRETNTIVYRAERDYLVAWDLALTAAVLIDRVP